LSQQTRSNIGIHEEILEALKWMLLIIVCVLVPVFQSKVEDSRIFNESMTVVIDKTSPTYAAFYDVESNLSDTYENVTKTQALVAGEEQDFAWMQIDERVQPKTKNLPQPEIRVLAEDKIVAPEVVAAAPPLPTMSDSSGDLLPLAQRKKRLLNYFQNNNINLKGRTWLDEAHDLLAISKFTNSLPTRKVIVGQNNNPVIVEKPKNKVLVNQHTKTGSGQAKTPKDRILAQNTNEGSAHKQNGQTGVSVFEVNPKPQLQTVISGSLSLDNGLALTSDQGIEVFWEEDGQNRQAAKVWLDQGKYEIVVDSLSGYLVAEVRDQNGVILGHQEVDLNKLSNTPYSKDKIEALDLTISPLSKGINAEVLSARSFKNHKIFGSDIRVIIDELGREIAAKRKGFFADASLINGSVVNLVVSAKNCWTTLFTAVAGITSKIKIFPAKMVEALIGLATKSNSEQQSQAIIWGQVRIDGKPVRGAVVELGGEEDLKPIYFQKYSEMIDLPDKKLKAT